MRGKKRDATKRYRKSIAANRWSKRGRDFRDDLIKLLVLGLPTALITKVFDDISGRSLKQPWQALWFLIPLAVVAWIFWQILKGRGEFQLNRRFLVFLSVYIVVFSLAAATNVLDWSRNLTVFRERAPRSWLTPIRAGDWRYFLVRKKSASRSGLLIVTMKVPDNLSVESARNDIMQLIAMAQRERATGVGLDFFFQKRSQIDPLFCQVVNNAKLPVISGYGFRHEKGRIVPTNLPDSLSACLAKEEEGHLAGFRDVDHRVRFVPMFYDKRPAFSVVVARKLASLGGREDQFGLPDERLLRFVAPEPSFQKVSYDELRRSPSLASLLTGHFILVGEDSKREQFNTPFGEVLGVQIHADAIHSLLDHCFIRSSPWWSSFLVILVSCYLLTVFAAQGLAKRQLVTVCLIVSATVVAISVFGMIIGSVWFDVVYPLVAVWLLLPLLLAFRNFGTKQRRIVRRTRTVSQ